MNAPPKKIAFFRQTHDSFTKRLDAKKSSAIQRIFLREASKYKNLEIIDVSNLKLKDKTNEALRGAIYAYHQANPVAGILGLRVIEGKHNSSIYNNLSSQGYEIYAPMQRAIYPLPLDIRSVTIAHTILGGFITRAVNRILEEWAEKKGIVPLSSTLHSNEWVAGLNQIFEKMGNVINADYRRKNNVDRKRHELNKLANDLTVAGYITVKQRDALKANRRSMVDFVTHESIHEVVVALRLVNQAASSAMQQYLKSVGFEFNKLMMGEIGQIANNKLHKENVREILASYSPAIGTVLDSDGPTAHVPLFHVPSCVNCDDNNSAPQLLLKFENSQTMEYLPCTDIQLTVECAGKILESKKMQGDFFKAVEQWAKGLPVKGSAPA